MKFASSFTSTAKGAEARSNTIWKRKISLFLLHRRQRERKREVTRFGNKKIRQGRPDEACKYLEEMMEKGMKAPQLDYNKFGADFSKNGNPGILEELARKMNFAGKFEVSNVLASWADMMKKNVERRGATRSFGPRM